VLSDGTDAQSLQVYGVNFTTVRLAGAQWQGVVTDAVQLYGAPLCVDIYFIG